MYKPYVMCPGDQGQPGPPGFQGPQGQDVISDRPGPSGNPGFPGSKGLQGKQMSKSTFYLIRLVFECPLRVSYQIQKNKMKDVANQVS